MSKQNPPSDEALATETRKHSYVGKGLTQNCYYWPFCGKAIDCGGIRSSECSKCGPGGTHERERPSEKELAARKKLARAQLRKEKRSKQQSAQL